MGSVQLDAFKEIETKERVFAEMAEARKVLLAEVREGMRRLYAHLKDYEGLEPNPPVFVCGDDARSFFEALPGVPPPEILSRNFLAAVWREPGWRVIPYKVHQSCVEGSHGRRVLCYEWVGEEQAAAA